MKVFFGGLLMVLKVMLWIVVMIIHVILNGIKIMILLLGLVMRLLFSFVKVGTV